MQPPSILLALALSAVAGFVVATTAMNPLPLLAGLPASENGCVVARGPDAATRASIIGTVPCDQDRPSLKARVVKKSLPASGGEKPSGKLDVQSKQADRNSAS